MGINPAESHERFLEAHDLIIRAWTEPGPFAYAGKHYNFRYVNPWPRPYQTAASADLDPVAGLDADRSSGRRTERYTYRADAEPDRRRSRVLPDVPRGGRQGRLRERRPISSHGRTDLHRRDRREGDARSQAASRGAGQPLLFKMPIEMLLPPGYTNFESMERIRAAKVVGKPQTIEDLVKDRRRHHRSARTRCARSSPSIRTSRASTPR